MVKNIHTEALLKACNDLNIKYRDVGESGVFIEIEANGKKHHFISSRSPLNNTVIDEIARDKGHTYELLGDVIKMPKTYSYIDPKPDKEFLEPYAKFKSISGIVNDIEAKLPYPFIIKMNRGSRGDNVYKVDDRDTAIKALETIFDKTSRKYDYVALAQEYVPIKADYRVTVVNKKIELVYRKDNTNAKFVGNLSPLHWEGAKAVIETDADLIKRISSFILPIFDHLDLQYAGLDVVLSDNNELFLLEINTHPAYNSLVEHCGNKSLVKVFKRIINEVIK